MNLDDKTYEEIERYLQGLMDDATKAEFEQRLSENNALNDLVTVLRTDPNFVSDQEIPDSAKKSDQLKENIKADHAGNVKSVKAERSEIVEQRDQAAKPSSSHTRTFSVVQVIRVAAVIVVLVIAAYLLFRSLGQQDLYDQFADHEKLVLQLSDASDELSQQAEQDFNKGNYETALPIMIELASTLPNTDYDLQLAIGISELETGQLDDAFNRFEAIMDSDAHNRDDAQYYAALTYIKSDRMDDALRQLENLRSISPDFRQPEMDKLILKLKEQVNSDD